MLQGTPQDCREADGAGRSSAYDMELKFFFCSLHIHPTCTISCSARKFAPWLVEAQGSPEELALRGQHCGFSFARRRLARSRRTRRENDQILYRTGETSIMVFIYAPTRL